MSVKKGDPNCSGCAHQNGISYQLEEVETNSIAVLQVDRVSLVHKFSHSISSRGDKRKCVEVNRKLPLSTTSFKEIPGEGDGQIAIWLSGRPSLQNPVKGSEPILGPLLQLQAQRQKGQTSSTSSEVPSKMVSGLPYKEKCSLEASSTYSRRPHWCLSGGMGFHTSRWMTKAGTWSPTSADCTSIQYIGISNSLHSHKVYKSSSEVPHTSPFR